MLFPGWNPAPDPPPFTITEFERTVLELTNAERTSRGLPALQYDEGLGAIARGHSGDMIRRRFFDHTNPDGDSPQLRVARNQRRLVGEAGENIWSGTGYAPETIARQAVEDWMKSPGHRANILQKDYTHLGVGIMFWGTEVRATQDFANVAAWVDPPVPAVVRRGETLRLSGRGVNGPPPSELELRANGRSAAGPWPLNAVAINAAPGVYTSWFYFSIDGHRFILHRGPLIEVR